MRKLTAEERRVILGMLKDALRNPLHFEMNQSRDVIPSPDPERPWEVRHEASPEVTLTLKVVYVPKGKTQ